MEDTPVTSSLREWLNTVAARQNAELATERDIWKAEAERLAQGYAKSKSNHDIVQETLELADQLYAAHGYISRPGFRYDQSSHPQERFMWRLAWAAQDLLCGTDAQDALDELETDEEEENDA